jgi:hypothetical protein
MLITRHLKPEIDVDQVLPKDLPMHLADATDAGSHDSKVYDTI